MKTNYEEKTFENYFNAALGRNSDVYFPLGQVQEGRIGADAVAFSRNRRLWHELGHPYWFRLHYRGVRFQDIAHEMEQFLSEEISNIPNIKTNLLFQYKRSEYLTSSSATEWPHWDGPYFRYDINAKQQSLLEHLQDRFQNAVLALYVAPAIKDINELVEQRRDILSHSNFRPITDLKNHSRNTFKNAGTHSIACSAPVRYENFDLVDNLRMRRSIDRSTPEMFKALADGVQEIMLSSIYGKSFVALMEYQGLREMTPQVPMLNTHLVMQALRDLTGIQWVVSL